MTKKIRAVQYGCGPIGCSVAALASSRAVFEMVGAVDIDPQKAGKDLGDLAGLGKKLGVVISPDVDAVLKETRPDVLFHTTNSQLTRIHSEIAGIVKHGVNVTSSCEELSFPYQRGPEVAADLDKLARENKVTVLGTGVNPGFLMDAWPLFMTGVCQTVTHVRVVRIQDARPRRLPFQKKIGAGRTPEEFQKLVDEGTLRHVGLPESVQMIAAGLGWEIDDVEETIEPVMAEKEVSSQYLTVKPGQAVGVKQVAWGRKAGKELISAEFQAYLGAPDTYDGVFITGTPNMEVIIKGGTHGDLATAAMVVNAAKRVVEAPPGLLTMKDIPPVICSEA